MSINSVLIVGISAQYTAEYIARVFYEQCFAKVSTVTLIPCIQQGEQIGQQAYVNIAEWCDSEIAYEFIQNLKKVKGDGVFFEHTADYWWRVVINTSKIHELEEFYQNTTGFEKSYYTDDEVEDEDDLVVEVEDDLVVEVEDDAVITVSCSGDKFTIPEAKERLIALNQFLYCDSDMFNVFDICQEIESIEQQIEFYEPEQYPLAPVLGANAGRRRPLVPDLIEMPHIKMPDFEYTCSTPTDEEILKKISEFLNPTYKNCFEFDTLAKLQETETV